MLHGGKSVLIGGVPGKSRATVWNRRGANSRQVGAGHSSQRVGTDHMGTCGRGALAAHSATRRGQVAEPSQLNDWASR